MILWKIKTVFALSIWLFFVNSCGVQNLNVTTDGTALTSKDQKDGDQSGDDKDEFPSGQPSTPVNGATLVTYDNAAMNCSATDSSSHCDALAATEIGTDVEVGTFLAWDPVTKADGSSLPGVTCITYPLLLLLKQDCLFTKLVETTSLKFHLTVSRPPESRSITDTTSVFVDSTPPSTPNGLVTAADSAAGANVTTDDDTNAIYFVWNAALDSESGIRDYTVSWYSQAACGGSVTSVTGITATNYALTNSLADGSTYSFKVTAYNTAGLASTTSSCSGDITITLSSGSVNVASSHALSRSSQRRTFFDSVYSRHWMLYYNGSQIEFAYSSDNITWNVAGNLAVDSSDFAITYRSFSGTPYVFVAVKQSAHITVYRGDVSATALTFGNGFAALSSGGTYQKPSVALNAAGNVWIAAVRRDTSAYGNNSQVVVVRSVNGGSGDLAPWHTPEALGQAGATISDVSILPRTGAEMYVLINGSQLVGYRYDGSSWSNASTGGSPSWFTFPTGGPNGSVMAMAVYLGQLYIGGTFTSVGGAPGTKYIARWDGTSWAGVGSGVENFVWSMAAAHGELYVGGTFSSAGGVNVDNIARWNGARWAAVGAGVSSNAYAMTVMGSDLYVGGSFTSAGGSAVNRVAKWDGSSWSALGAGCNSTVQALAVMGSDLYVGGGFTQAGGVAQNRIAKWDGSAWSGVGTGFNGNVLALSVSGATLYAGGQFTTADGVAANYVAKWNGSGWFAMGTGMNAAVRGVLADGSDVYAAGDFTTASGNAATYVAKWNGSSWSDVGGGLTGSSSKALIKWNSLIYVGGTFTQAGSVVATNVASWNGSSWSDFSGASGFNGSVRAIAIYGSDVIVGGLFTEIDGVTVNHIARWNGSAWSSINGGITGTNVFALTVSGSNLYVGGSFTAAGGMPANNIAVYDGMNWSAIAGGTNGTVNAISIAGVSVYVGGDFTSVNSGVVSANHVARWDGSSWSALGTGVNGTVNAIAALSSNIYVGGGFSTAGGASASGLAKWDGTVWSNLGSGVTGGQSEVKALVISGPDLFVAGDFTHAGGVASASVAKLAGGSIWEGLGSGISGTIWAAKVVDTSLFVGGYFINVAGSSCYHLARWDGTDWSCAGGGVNSNVLALARDGMSLYVGGNFYNVIYEKWPSKYFARYDPHDTITQGNLFGMSAVSNPANGEIHTLVTSDTSVTYYKYSGSVWSAPVTLASGAQAFMPSISFDAGSGKIWAFWIEAGIVKYKQYSAGSWSGSATNLTTSAVAPSGMTTDIQLGDSVIKVMLNDVADTQKKIIIQTVN